MVSIIISSYQPNYLEKLKRNILETIGVPFEILAIENKGMMSICSAYNLGATKANFPYLCFMHEDISFKTINWSKPLINKFETDISTGVIGIAGGRYKSISPSIWLSGVVELDRINIIQHSKSKKNEYVNYLPNKFEEVVCLDGVFLFTKKSIWAENKFDELTFTNFHCYDLDFSFQVGLTKTVLVTNTVLLEHFSMGSYDKSWIDETIIFHDKWKDLLPKGKVNYKIQSKIEWNNRITFLLRMAQFKFSLTQFFAVGFGYGFKNFFSIRKALTITKLIISAYAKTNIWKRK